jgi:processing peptidase subunit alpha
MSVDLLREYRATHFTADRMVLAGAGVSHDEFAELGGKYFAALPRGRDVIDRKDSPYTGGDARLQMPEPGPGGIIEPPLTRVALAFETGGWHDERFVPTCVLQVRFPGLLRAASCCA